MWHWFLARLRRQACIIAKMCYAANSLAHELYILHNKEGRVCCSCFRCCSFAAPLQAPCSQAHCLGGEHNAKQHPSSVDWRQGSGEPCWFQKNTTDGESNAYFIMFINHEKESFFRRNGIASWRAFFGIGKPDVLSGDGIKGRAPLRLCQRYMASRQITMNLIDSATNAQPEACLVGRLSGRVLTSCHLAFGEEFGQCERKNVLRGVIRTQQT